MRARASAQYQTTRATIKRQTITTIMKLGDMKHEESKLRRLKKVPLELLIADLLIVPLLLLLAASAVAEQTSKTDESRAGATQLERDLGQLLRQHDIQDANSNLLSGAIISHLMLGNMSDGSQEPQVALVDVGGAGQPATQLGREIFAGPAHNSNNQDDDDQVAAAAASAAAATSPEATLPGDRAKLRRILDFLVDREFALSAQGGGPFANYDQYPVLPSGQAATIKRAAKYGNQLRQQQQQRQLNGGAYARNTYDFGLGKRPDTGVSSNILRFGDSSLAPGTGHLGKRPSAHRYDFGLGKRYANPAYPRYDFGLGKRAPSRVRYDFGLG